ncbi:hypothetical protein NZ47_02820 [Anaerovibrio lipolyticus]|uniref:Uncharacterized protein n=1 Tax=Anaerovibrio lipolyticus TaxID=82374 RepID=A0A0B2JWW3_9FIRM|nr:hypothetical protein [Anaerovibrio lipolyticus]KHM52785.1 hypothetical protein NZ47_02820 [Anaerovibrio lipolyticus]
MNYEDSSALQYPLIKDYIDRMYGKSKIDFPSSYFYPMQLSASPNPDKIIKYQRKFINYLAISIVYALLPADLRKIFHYKFVKKYSSVSMAYRVQCSEYVIYTRINSVYDQILSILNYQITDNDLLDSRILLNVINLLDMRISILVRYNLTDATYYDKLCRLRSMYSRLYSGYVDLYNKPETDDRAKVIMLFDFNREISVSFLAENLNYCKTSIYNIFQRTKKKMKKISGKAN